MGGCPRQSSWFEWLRKQTIKNGFNNYFKTTDQALESSDVVCKCDHLLLKTNGNLSLRRKKT